MLSVAVLITWLAVLGPGCSAQNAGVKAVLSSSGLDFVSNQIRNTLSNMLQGYGLTSQNGRSGYFEYSLHNIKVNIPTPLQLRMRFIESHGLEITVSMATVKATANFWASLTALWFPVTESGSLYAELSNLEIKGTVQVGGRYDGRPSLNFLTCQAKLGNMTLQVRGETAWVAQAMQSLLEPVLRDFIERAVLCQQLQKEITQNAERQLAKIPLTVTVFNNYQVDLGLAATPSVRAHSVETLHRGTFSRIGERPANLPYTPTLPPWQGMGGMVQVMVSEATVASLMSALQTNQELIFHLNASNAHPAIVQFLTISSSFPSVGTLLPGLKDRYFGRRTSVTIASDSVPRTTLGAGKLRVQGVATVTLNLDTPTSVQPLVQIRLDYQIRVNGTLQPDKLFMKVEGVDRLNVRVKQSTIGSISDAHIQQLAEFFVDRYVIPDFNDENRGEIPIPVINNVDLVNPRLMIIPGAIQVATDLSAHP